MHTILSTKRTNTSHATWYPKSVVYSFKATKATSTCNGSILLLLTTISYKVLSCVLRHNLHNKILHLGLTIRRLRRSSGREGSAGTSLMSRTRKTRSRTQRSTRVRQHLVPNTLRQKCDARSRVLYAIGSRCVYFLTSLLQVKYLFPETCLGNAEIGSKLLQILHNLLPSIVSVDFIASNIPNLVCTLVV